MNDTSIHPPQQKMYTYLPALDVLRFLVFLMILANHTNLNRAVNGHSFFFTLTGFLISYISIAEIRKKGSFHFKRYLARRFLRTLPLFYLIVAISFTGAAVVQLSGYTPVTTGPLWPFLLLIQNYFELNIFFPLSNLWAMGVTEQYYLLLGLLFFFFYRWLHWFGWIMCITGLLVNCISYFGYNFYSHSFSWYFLVNFGIGNMLALFCLNRGALFQKLAASNVWQTILLYLLGIGLLVVGFWWQASWFIPFKELVLSSGYCCLIFNLGFGKHKPFEAKKAVLLQQAGKRTLGFYCWHAPVLTIVEKTTGYLSIPTSAGTLFIITLLLCIPVVYLSYRYFEQGFLVLKDRLFA